MITRVALVLLMPVYMLAAIVHAQSLDSDHSRLIELGLPEEVGSFRLSGSQDFGDPSLGVAFSYVGSVVFSEITLYVYPIPEDAPDHHRQARVRRPR